jgi:hypothetical protein
MKKAFPLLYVPKEKIRRERKKGRKEERKKK